MNYHNELPERITSLRITIMSYQNELPADEFPWVTIMNYQNELPADELP